jgi:ParB/RepB/Spo0J family partition protein
MARKPKTLPGSDLALEEDDAPPAPTPAHRVREGDDPAFDGAATGPRSAADIPTRLKETPVNLKETPVKMKNSGTSMPADLRAEAVAAERAVSPDVYPVELIKTDEIYVPANHRHEKKPDKAANEAKIKGLMASITAAGLEQPIRVYRLGPGQHGAMGKAYELSFGFRRLEACKRLGWAIIPSQVLPPAAQALIKQARAIENLHRDDLTPAGEMLMVRDILEAAGGDRARAAAAIGKEEWWVRDRDYLTRCTPLVIELLDSGRLLLGHARQLAKVGDPKVQDSLARQAARSKHETDTGSMWPVDRLTDAIADAQRSLKVVPWKLELEFAGKPACTTCTHNTASDLTLFQTGKEDVGLGCCTNDACFNAKQTAAQKSKDTVVATLRKRQMEPSAENVRQAAPEFLKDTNVIGFARRQLGEPKNPAAGKAPSTKSEVEVWNDAANKYEGAVDAWKRALAQQCFKAAGKAAPLVRVAMLSVVASEEWSESRQEPVGHSYSRPPQKVAIHTFKAAGPVLAGVIAGIAAPTLDSLLRLGRLKWSDTNDAMPWSLQTCPDCLIRLADALGVKVTDPLPTWDEFKPKGAKDEKPSTTEATSAKKVKGGKTR